MGRDVLTSKGSKCKEVLNEQVRAALDVFERAADVTEEDEEHMQSGQSLVSENFETLIQASLKLISTVSSVGGDLRLLRFFPRALARKAFALSNLAARPELLECERLRKRVKEVAALHTTSNRCYLEELCALRNLLRKDEVSSVRFDNTNQYLWDALETLPEEFRGLASDVLVEKLKCFVSQSHGATLSELQSTIRRLQTRLQQLESEKAEAERQASDALSAKKEMETRMGLMTKKYDEMERSSMISSGALTRSRYYEDQYKLEQARNKALDQEVKDLQELLGGGEVQHLEEELSKSRKKCAELQHHYNNFMKRSELGKDLNFSVLNTAGAVELLKVFVPNFGNRMAWAMNDTRISSWLTTVSEKVLHELVDMSESKELENVRRVAAERRLRSLRQSLKVQRGQSLFFQQRDMAEWSRQSSSGFGGSSIADDAFSRQSSGGKASTPTERESVVNFQEDKSSAAGDRRSTFNDDDEDKPSTFNSERIGERSSKFNQLSKKRCTVHDARSVEFKEGSIDEPKRSISDGAADKSARRSTVAGRSLERGGTFDEKRKSDLHRIAAFDEKHGKDLRRGRTFDEKRKSDAHRIAAFDEKHGKDLRKSSTFDEKLAKRLMRSGTFDEKNGKGLRRGRTFDEKSASGRGTWDDRSSNDSRASTFQGRRSFNSRTSSVHERHSGHGSASAGYKSTGSEDEDEDSVEAEEQLVEEAVEASPAFQFLMDQMASPSSKKPAENPSSAEAAESNEPPDPASEPKKSTSKEDSAEDAVDVDNMAALTLKRLIADHVLLERKHSIAMAQLAEWRMQAISDGRELAETKEALELTTASLLHPAKVGHIRGELRKLKVDYAAVESGNKMLKKSLEVMKKRVVELERLNGAPSESAAAEQIDQIVASCNRTVFNKLYEDALRREQRVAVLVEALRVPRSPTQQLVHSLSAPCRLTELLPIEDMVLETAHRLAETRAAPLFSESLLLSAEFPAKSRHPAIRRASVHSSTNFASVDDRATGASDKKDKSKEDGTGEEVERVGSLVVRKPAVPSTQRCSAATPMSQRSTAVSSPAAAGVARSVASSPVTGTSSAPLSARTTPGPGSRPASPMDFAVPTRPHSARAARSAGRMTADAQLRKKRFDSAPTRPQSATCAKPMASDIALPGARPKSAGSAGRPKQRSFSRTQPVQHAAPEGSTVETALDALKQMTQKAS